MSIRALVAILHITVCSAPVLAGGSLLFDGIDDYVLVPHDVEIDFESSDDFTVELWFKTALQPPTTYMLLEKWESGTMPYPYVLRLDTDGTVRAASYIGSPSPSDVIVGEANLIDGAWHHVAMVRRSTTEIRLFVDGAPAGTNPAIQVGSIANSFDLTFATRGPGYSGTASQFNGLLDETRIWNRALSATEIANLHNRRLTGTEAGLVAYWTFDDGGGFTLADLTGNGHEGTLGDVAEGDQREPAWSVDEPPLNSSGFFVVGHSPDGFVSQPISSADVTFSSAVGTSSFTAADIQMTGPTGPIAVDEPLDLGGNTWRIGLPEQSADGEYHLYIGPHVEDLEANEMDQDGDGTAGEDPDDVYDASFTMFLGGMVFTVDTLIDDGDTTYDGMDIVVDGCTVTINGAHTFARLWITSGGGVTHTAGQSGSDLTITGDLTVDAGGAISVDGKGYGSSAGPGQGEDLSSYASGAGYGGVGGDAYNGFAVGGPTYGSITEPIDLGSGGGRATGYSANGGAGGGAIRLTVDGTFALDGSVTADGANGASGSNPSYGGGGGAGGSVYLTVGTLSGVGSITANGGDRGGTNNNSGGGGGGRIAIYYDTDTFAGTTMACGGSGYQRGGAGTIFRKSSAQTYGDLLVDNCGNLGSRTVLPDGMYAFDTVDVANIGKLETTSGVTVAVDVLDIHDDGRFIAGGLVQSANGLILDSVGHFTVSGDGDIDFPYVELSNGGTLWLDKPEVLPIMDVQSGGVLTHSSTITGFDLTITGDLTVDAGGAISVDGKGYGSSAGPGQGEDLSSYASGAGYGGVGGDAYNGFAVGGPTYGSITEPIDLGSGGGRATGYSANGGAGGGAIRLTVDGTFALDGSVTADGANGASGSNPSYGGGGGAGGSVYLTVGTLSGVGSITANGGDRGGTNNNSGGGGGGRIAIYYDTDTFAGTTMACGGSGYQRGGAGTIFRQSSAQTYGDLLVDNCGNSGARTVLPDGTYAFDSVDVANKAVLDIPAAVTLTTEPGILSVQNEGELLVSGQVGSSGGGGFALVEVLSGGDLTINDGGQLVCTDAEISSQGVLTVNGAGFDAENVEVLSEGTFLLNTADSYVNLHVASGGVVTHTSGQNGFDLTITGDLTVDAGGSISADGKGYGSSSGPGQGEDLSSYASGAGYGGVGGDAYNGFAVGGPTYGSITEPIDLGSGGGRATGYSANGGAGGGAIRLTVDGTFALDGSVTADGANGASGSNPSYGGGGGAGGSVYLTVGTLSGVGSITANGGDRGGTNNNSGGGGGGRIAIYYDTDTFAGTTMACGGSGYQRGGAGTIFRQSSAQTYGDLLVDNCGNSGARTVLPDGTYAFDSVDVANKAVLDIPAAVTLTTEPGILSVQNEGELLVSGQVGSSGGGGFALVEVLSGGDLTINDGGQLVCTDAEISSQGVLTVNGAGFDAENVEVLSEGTFLLNTADSYVNLHVASGGVVTHTSGQNGFDLTITGDLTVDAGGSISADGKGYGSSSGPGQGEDLSSYASGAGYGGVGGDAYNGFAVGGPTYGSITEPIDLGSGGGRATGYSANGGAGGGAIRLTVDGTFALDGSVTADGANGASGSNPSYGGGGGAGGSVYLTVGTLSGVGSITANGGDRGGTNNNSGGGGGGRIAIYYDTDTFAGTTMACGGSGYQRGGAGTIFRQSSAQTYGDLLVDNCGNSGARTVLPDGTYAFDSVDVANKAVLDIPAAVTLTTEPGILSVQNEGELLVSGQVGSSGGGGFALVEVLSGGDLTINDGGQLVCTDAEISSQGVLTVNGAGFDAENVEVLSEGTFLLNTADSYVNLHVASGGVVTHTSGQNGFDLTITGDLTVDAGGSISADGKGYGSSSGPGQGEDLSSYASGAGYGGVGGDAYNGFAVGGPTYGSITEPIDLGSGGGRATGYSANGGAGGGAIRLTVDGTFALDGSVTADGANGASGSNPSYGGGGGAGGSVYLTVGTLSGVGSITANGGDRGGTNNNSGGGGGGRIAIYYLDMSGFDVGNIAAAGGSGYEYGDPGTIWVRFPYPHVMSHTPSIVNYMPVDFIDITFSELLDGITFDAEDIVMTGPEGAIAIADPPVDLGTNAWRISFPPQSAHGEYHVYIGPHVGDLDGNEMDQNMNQVLGEEPLPPGGPPYTDLGDVYEAIFTIRPPALYVDDDAVSDPGPGDPGISDPDEDGTPDHPYDSIQEAIDVALEFDDVIVLPGTYFENISFDGKRIRLTSSDPSDQAVVTATIIDGTRSGSVLSFTQAEDPQSVLTGLTIVNGRADNGGGILISGASPTIAKNIIEDNRSDVLGAAIYCSNSQALISDNRISSNFGAGIACSGASATPTIEHNIITDNWLRGVHCLSSAAPLVRNNIIAWNFGEGIKCESSAAPQVVNCTITNNDLTGVLSSSASPMITSCILWDNTNDLSGCSATYSIVQDGDNGQGNTPFAPHFVNPLIDDFHLRSWSPGIDAGDPNYVADPNETDIDGDDRILLAQVDMGADESGVMSPDTDGDGLPDDWEEYHWPGDLSQGPADDPDVDGISNLGEYLFDRDPTVIDSDPLAIRLVEWSAGSIDSSAAETVGISYLLDRHAYVTVNLHNGDTNVLVRTVVDGEFQPAGFNAVIWDGHGDPNDPLAADSPALPQGAYYFEIFADDPLSAGSDPPHHGEWLKRSNTSPAYTGTTTVSGDFNPFLNDLVEIRTTLTQTGIAPLTIRDTGSGNATIRNLRPVLDGGVLETIFWDGRYNDGTIFTGSYEVYFAVPRGVPGNSIIVRNQALQITNLVCEAYMILPSYGEVSTIKYTLPVNADVSIDMTDPDGDHFRTLLTDQPQAAGPQQIIWDGRNDTDQMIAKEGDYTVVITAVDPVTGTTTTRFGIVVAYR